MSAAAYGVEIDFFMLIMGLLLGFSAGWYARIVWVGAVNIFSEITAFFQRTMKV